MINIKKILKRIIILIILLSIILNSSIFNSSYALTPGEEISNVIGKILSGLIGILTFPTRLVAVAFGWTLQAFTSLIAFVDGSTDSSIIVTPYDIFFNNVKILDINFFKIGEGGEVIQAIRKSVSSWYYALRFLSLSILLVILIYVGIKMAISTIASEQAQYKKMLVDWACSIALVFILHYVILSLIYVNQGLINAIKVGTSSSAEYTDSILYLMKEGLGFSINSVAAAGILCLLAWQTFGFFVIYFNRMLKIGFLIIISPLITITYSIDKMGDGKAQALNNWFKEIVFTILIQPFHCIMYLALVQTALELLKNHKGTIEDRLVTALIAVVLVNFLKKGEKIVRKIFGFKDDNEKMSMAKAVIQTKIALNAVKGAGNKASKLGTGTKNAIMKARNFSRDAKIQTAAAASYLLSKDGSSYKDHVEQATVNDYDKRAEKLKANEADIAKALGEKRNAKTERMHQDNINKLKDEIMTKNDGAISEDVALAQANYEYRKKRANAAKNIKKASKKQGKYLGKKISKKKKSKSSTTTTTPSSSSSVETPTDIQNGSEAENTEETTTPENRSTSSVVGKLKDLYDGVKSPVKDMVPDLLKGSVASGAGFFAGSGVIASSENFGQSLVEAYLVGKAASDEFRDFSKGIDSTMKNELKSQIKARGITDSAGLNKMINEVNNNSEKYDLSSEKGKKELDKLADNMIQKINDKLGSKADQVSGMIKDAIKNNPRDAVNIINNQITSALSQDGKASVDAIKSSKEYQNLVGYARNVSLASTLSEFEGNGGDINEIILPIATKLDKANRGNYQIDEVQNAVMNSDTDEEKEQAAEELSASCNSVEEAEKIQAKIAENVSIREKAEKQIEKRISQINDQIKANVDNGIMDNTSLKTEEDKLVAINNEYEEQIKYLNDVIATKIKDRITVLEQEARMQNEND